MAGIAMAIAFILQYLAAGTRWVEDRLRILPVNWIGLGLLLAAATGMASWLFGYPFLTSYSQYVELPLVGAVPLASALLFDLGVFGLVVGATVLMLIALAHQSIRKLRAARTTTAQRPGGGVMELILALGIGVLAGSGVWLLLRPRTYQVIIGLSLCSYAVNLFIFSMGRLRVGAPPVAGIPARAASRTTPIRCPRPWSSRRSSSASRRPRSSWSCCSRLAA